jgi:D-lactate dehydrogenase
MRVAMFDTHRFEQPVFEKLNARFGHEISFLEPRLTAATAQLAAGATAVCSFVNDKLDAAALGVLAGAGVKVIALRSAGYNHVDLVEAARLGLPVVRVPEYSPHAVAEHAVALLLALNRKLPRAHARVRDGNFSLDGLVGFDLAGKTVGIVGMGRIGRVASQIFRGFGCHVIAADVRPVEEPGVRDVNLTELYRQSDIISLHCPLTPATYHLVDGAALQLMKPGVVLLNTGRGALVDSRALIDGLKSGRVGAAGLDVYEEEEGLFFRDLSDKVLQDDVAAPHLPQRARDRPPGVPHRRGP